MGPQGDKETAPITLDVPKAVPLTAARIGDRMVVSVPGEMTEGMGRRVRAAVTAASAGHGIARTVISGLANEYADYFTSPQEYDAQHYEGAATVYGRASSVAIEEVLVRLARALVGGKPGPKPYVYDPRNGIRAGARPFSKGAKHGKITAQPRPAARRLAHPSFSWQGGPKGTDRPLDRAFVQVQRRTGARWETVQSDLGLQILWTVDDGGAYRAEWEPTFATRLGRYRFLISANRYRLRSRPFHVRPARTLELRRAEAGPHQVAFTLAYPPARAAEAVGDPPGDLGADLTDRPAQARAGHATVLVNGVPHFAFLRDGVFTVAARHGDRVEVRLGAARDRYGNANRVAVNFTA
jgi:neutral ceramidase